MITIFNFQFFFPPKKLLGFVFNKKNVYNNVSSGLAQAPSFQFPPPPPMKVWFFFHASDWFSCQIQNCVFDQLPCQGAAGGGATTRKLWRDFDDLIIRYFVLHTGQHQRASWLNREMGDLPSSEPFAFFLPPNWQFTSLCTELYARSRNAAESSSPVRSN